MPDQRHIEIISAIQGYASAYNALEKLQEEEQGFPPEQALLPHKGDQKTGVIGEYWAMRYARRHFKENIVFGQNSQKGWDLKVNSVPPRYIQVKAASEFGKGSLTPIHFPMPSANPEDDKKDEHYWDELWILYLDRCFLPVILWKFEPGQVAFDGNKPLRLRKMRRPGNTNTGSDCFAWDEAEEITDIREQLRLT